jgi:hypothetical protein
MFINIFESRLYFAATLLVGMLLAKIYNSSNSFHDDILTPYLRSWSSVGCELRLTHLNHLPWIPPLMKTFISSFHSFIETVMCLGRFPYLIPYFSFYVNPKHPSNLHLRDIFLRNLPHCPLFVSIVPSMIILSVNFHGILCIPP